MLAAGAEQSNAQPLSPACNYLSEVIQRGVTALLKVRCAWPLTDTSGMPRRSCGLQCNLQFITASHMRVPYAPFVRYTYRTVLS